MRQFAGIDLVKEPVPDETRIHNFRHLMERYNPGDQMFRLVNVYVAENGLKVTRGTFAPEHRTSSITAVLQLPIPRKRRHSGSSSACARSTIFFSSGGVINSL